MEPSRPWMLPHTSISVEISPIKNPQIKLSASPTPAGHRHCSNQRPATLPPLSDSSFLGVPSVERSRSGRVTCSSRDGAAAVVVQAATTAACACRCQQRGQGVGASACCWFSVVAVVQVVGGGVGGGHPGSRAGRWHVGSDLKVGVELSQIECIKIGEVKPLDGVELFLGRGSAPKQPLIVLTLWWWVIDNIEWI